LAVSTKYNILKRRTKLIAAGTLNSLASPFTNILFSILVVKLYGTGDWGSFVYYFLYASLASLVLNWGNKDYLLREISKNPAEIGALWRKSFTSRLVLLLPLAIIFLLSFPYSSAVYLIIWILLLFISQSFEVFVTFHRKFMLSFALEIFSSLMMFGSIIFLKDCLGFSALIYSYFLYLSIKATAYLIYFRGDVFRNSLLPNGKLIDLTLLKNSFTFFLIGITGMLSSRVDQYTVSYFLPKETLGEYQVLKNFLIYFQSAANFMILPFIKNLYRLKDDSMDKMGTKLGAAGLILIIPMISVLYAIIEIVYGFKFPPEIYLYSALFILPGYYSSVIIYKLFKNSRQSLVVMVSVIGIVISLALNVILIPKMQSSGALLSGVVSVWVSAIIFFFLRRAKK
jgi:O-antigen/teichoic acid export membrane protein